MTRRACADLLLALLAACGRGGSSGYAVPGDRAPATTVEVLNASGRSGDARTGTRLLRHAGIDVVYFGNAAESGLDTTRIIVRRGSALVGEQIRAALGTGRIEIQLDSGRLLDASVLLGRDFSPPPAPFDFHP